MNPLQGKRVAVCVLTIAVWLLFTLSPTSSSAQTVRVAIGAASVATLPTWVAAEGGYFSREGLRTEVVYIRGGPQAVERGYRAKSAFGLS